MQVWILIKREFYFFVRNYADVYTVEAKFSNRNFHLAAAFPPTGRSIYKVAPLPVLELPHALIQ